MRARAGPVALLLALALAGCGQSTVDSRSVGDRSTVDSAPSAQGSCLPPASWTGPPASWTGPLPSGLVAQVPDLALECLAGGGVVRLTELHRPAIVNLWAAWCQPCRQELPAFQSYATRHAGQVIVIGVVTGDTRAGARGLMLDVGVTFPTLFDERRRLQAAVGRNVLPVTLFIDAGGGLRRVYSSKTLDEAGIAELAETSLGVAR
jgi:thiol-disulfide isomerase/thioredoxin